MKKAILQTIARHRMAEIRAFRSLGQLGAAHIGIQSLRHLRKQVRGAFQAHRYADFLALLEEEERNPSPVEHFDA